MVPVPITSDANKQSQATNMVKLPEQHDSIIMDPFLAYCVFAMQSGTMDRIKIAVMGHFSAESISAAKTLLWSKCNTEIIGPEQKH